MAYCSKCGKEIEDGDSFCHACGAAMTKPGRAAGTTPPQVTSPAQPMPPGAPLTGAVMPPTPRGYASTAPAPPPQMQSLEEVAAKRVKQRIELLEHIGTYVIVNAFIVVVWALSGAGYPWFLWVLAGWGIGLAFHVMSYVLGSRGYASRENMIQKEMDRMKRQGAPAEPARQQEEQEPPT